MNIRSIDLQVLIPHATEVGKTQHTTNQQNAAQQQDFAMQWQRIAQDRQQQVQLVNHSEGGKVKEKQESPEKHQEQDEQDHSQQQDSQENQESSPEQLAHDPIRGHLIDIKM